MNGASFTHYEGIYMKKGSTLMGWSFTAPALIFFTGLTMIPLIMSFGYGLTKWNGISTPAFVGFQNYIKIFKDADYWKTFSNTMTLMVVSLIFQVFLGLILAWLMCNAARGFKIFRTIFFLPVIVAPMAIGLMFSLLYNSEFGIINILLDMLGLSGLKREWLSDPDIVLSSVVIPQVWQYIGLYITIFAAAIHNIPDDVFESAKIDGANKWYIFWRIVSPMVKDITRISMVLAVTGSLKAFDHAWAITNGGPGNASAYLAIYTYKTAFVKSNFGYASAVSSTILLVSLILSFMVRKLVSTDEGVS